MTQFSFWETVVRDAQAADGKIDPHASRLKQVLQIRRFMRYRPGFSCVFWLRVNQLFLRKGWRGHVRIRVWRYYWFHCDISEYAEIGPGFFLPHPTDVTVGSTVKIGKDVTLYNGVTLGGKRFGERESMPVLGDGVVVYTGAKVIGAIHVGDGAWIGAGAICVKDVPAKHVMIGIPPNVMIKPKAS